MWLPFLLALLWAPAVVSTYFLPWTALSYKERWEQWRGLVWRAALAIYLLGYPTIGYLVGAAIERDTEAGGIPAAEVSDYSTAFLWIGLIAGLISPINLLVREALHKLEKSSTGHNGYGS